MKKEKSITLILFKTILLFVLVFAIYWTATNFDKIKDGLSGSNLYTYEQIEEVRKEERERWLEERQEYQTLITELREDSNSKLEQIIELTTSLNELRQAYDNGEITIELLEETVSNLNEAVAVLTESITTLNNKITHYEKLLEAYENQDKTMITFYIDNVVYEIIFTDGKGKLNRLPAPPKKDNHYFLGWSFETGTNDKGLVKQGDMFTENTSIFAIFIQEHTAGLSFRYDAQTNSYEISKGSSTSANIALPGYWYVSSSRGVLPTSVSNQTFVNSNIKTLIIGAGLIEIKASAFSNNQIVELNIPNSVKKIGMGAFSGNKLTRVNLPTEIVEISASSFKQNNLTEIIIPNSVTTIGDQAFQGNELVIIMFPENIDKIGNEAFRENKLVGDLVIPINLKVMGDYAFRDNLLRSITISKDLETHPYRVFVDKDVQIIQV